MAEGKPHQDLAPNGKSQTVYRITEGDAHASESQTDVISFVCLSLSTLFSIYYYLYLIYNKYRTREPLMGEMCHYSQASCSLDGSIMCNHFSSPVIEWYVLHVAENQTFFSSWGRV